MMNTWELSFVFHIFAMLTLTYFANWYPPMLFNANMNPWLLFWCYTVLNNLWVLKNIKLVSPVKKDYGKTNMSEILILGYFPENT